MSDKLQSFPDYQTKEGIKIRFERYLSIRQLFQESTVSKLQDFFSNDYQEQFSKIIFIFRVYYDRQYWNLKKTFLDLYNFQHAIRKKYKDVPKFPLGKDDEESLDEKTLAGFRNFLQCFLKSVYQNALKDPIFTSFLEVFPQKLGHGIIYGEYPFLKRSGGRFNQTSRFKDCYHGIFPCSRNWRYRYFSVTDNGILYSEDYKTYDIKDILIYCFKFNFYFGALRTGRQLGIVLESSTRRLKLEAEELYILVLFIVSIKQALKNSPFSDEKRTKYQKYGSFAPVRENCSSKFYIDGKGYFEDLFEQLKKAKRYVYITGWMITPYFMLKRPKELFETEYRFDGVLQELAKRGVKIYIILYQQPKIAINNDSQFVEKYLEQLGGANIKVVRHPNYLVIPFLWSHHEKIVLIDQKVAFLGGLDICYGRWDTQEHHLFNPPNQVLWEGADFCNLRIRDIYRPRDFMMSNLTFTEPKMPWHDVAIQLKGPSVNDIARHFTNYWNFVNLQTKIDDDRELLHLAGLKHHQSPHSPAKNSPSKYSQKKSPFGRKTGKIQQTIEMVSPTQRFKARPSQLHDHHLGLHHTSPGFRVNYLGKSQNQYLMSNSSKLSQNSSGFKGERDSKLSARTFLSSRSSTSNRRKESIEEQFYDRCMREQQHRKSNMNIFKQKILKYPIKLLEMFKETDSPEQKLIVTNENRERKYGRHQHLVLRSSSTWSSGLSQTEYSIHQAYCQLIKNAKQFIYIQNQFFIARENLVVEELAKRILQAYHKQQLFKVMIFIPLLPGFQGDVRQSNSTVMRIQLHLEYETICRSNNSLYSMLLDGGIKKEQIQNYLKFFSLRQHAAAHGLPVTEILYIHSKLMIVDDNRLIIGSANINDRSLLGDRDSEIAVLIEQDTAITIEKGQEHKNYFKDIKSFRVNLLQEHFGVGEAMAERFYEEQTWRELKGIAKRNTEIYRYIFGCYPDDKMKRMSDISLVQNETMPFRSQRYQMESKHIQGHAVELPLHFLEEQNLEIQITEKEIILPDFFFT